MFSKIQDSTYQDASKVIDAVHSGVPADGGGLPNLSAVAAGAAIVLEKHHPNILYDVETSKAERYVQQGTNEWRMLHNALARVIDVDARDPTTFHDHGDVLRHVVGDVSHQARFSRLKSGIDIPDLAGRVPDDLKPLMDVSYIKDVASKITSQVSGSYDELPERDQAALSSQLLRGSALSAQLAAGVKRMSSVMELQGEELSHIESGRLDAGSRDVPFEFRPVSPSAMRSVDDLLSRDISTGNVDVDRALRAHAAAVPAKESFGQSENVMGVVTNDPHTLLARARLVDDVTVGALQAGPGEMARRIESDRLIMSSARMSHDIYGRNEDSLTGMGAYHLLPHHAQDKVQEKMAVQDNVPMLTSLRIDDGLVPQIPEARSINVQRQVMMAQGLQR